MDEQLSLPYTTLQKHSNCVVQLLVFTIFYSRFLEQLRYIHTAAQPTGCYNLLVPIKFSKALRKNDEVFDRLSRYTVTYKDYITVLTIIYARFYRFSDIGKSGFC